MARIFLSHASADNAKALALAAWLESHGWSDYFLDVDETRGLVPGDRWLAALAAAVDQCEAVIFLVSPDWKRSKFCFAEFYQAKSLGKRIFGVVVKPIDLATLPEQMTSEWQVCDLTPGNDPESFPVERPPLVPPSVVAFSGAGLRALARGLQKAGLAASTFVWPPKDDPLRPPYPGLRALDESDAAVFFGRDAAIVRAIDQIRLVRERDVERLFVILGASGAGKSSFLRAGLIPRLRRDDEHFVVLPTMRPESAAISGSHGLIASLQCALTAAGETPSLAQLRAELADAGLAGPLLRIARGPRPAATAAAGAARTVIIPIDQGEELFLADGRAEAQELLQHIDVLLRRLAARRAAGLRVLFVIAIRSDALARLQGNAVLQSLSPVLFSLPALPMSEFKAVIEGPARRHSETVKPLLISPELADELVADAEGADALPLLALTLDHLYREFTTAEGTRIGRDEYARLGGVRGVIGIAVQRALQHAGQAPAIPAEPAEQDRLLRHLFPYLATVDPDTGEGKRRVSARQAIRQAVPRADALVSRLVEQRLLMTDRRRLRADGEPVEVVEVAHEALLRQWDKLENWLGELSDELSAAERLRRAANDWEGGGRDPLLLVHAKSRLEAAEALLNDERLVGRFAAVDAQYVAACRERERDELREREVQLQLIADEQARRARLQRRATWGLIGGTAIVLGFVAWIVLQAQSISRQTSLVIASAAESAAEEGRFDQSFRLSVLAYRGSWLHPAHHTAGLALVRAADALALRALLVGHRGAVLSANFSPSGQRVVTGSEDGTARIWDAETGEAVGTPMGHGGPVRSAVFSSDGRRLVTASDDKTVRVWDAETGKAIGRPMGHEKRPRSAGFTQDGAKVIALSGFWISRVWDVTTGVALDRAIEFEERLSFAASGPLGRRLVMASRDDTVRVWDAETGKALSEPIRHGGTLSSAGLSRNGERVVTVTTDGIARVWDVESRKTLGKPMQQPSRVVSTGVSFDGRRVVTALDDKTVRVWDAENGEALGVPMKHDGAVRSAEFSPDGQRVVTASDDGTARIWRVDPGKALGTWMNSDRGAYSAIFNPDGQRVVTASSVRAYIWDANTGEAIGAPMKHVESVWSAVFSPDGKRVVTASNDWNARLWDARTGKAVGERMHHGGIVNSAVFSPDGGRVVTASHDETARVWSAETGRPLSVPMLHDAGILSAVFSPDGTRVATASQDETARVWDAESGRAIGEPMRHGGGVNSAVFSPDGVRVATASQDWTARIWDAATGAAQGRPMKHNGPVLSAVFSPDGSHLTTASDDGTARVWDAATSTALGEPMQHHGPVRSAVFSPDGDRVVTASRDGTARVWHAETGKALCEPIRHDKPVSSASFNHDGTRVITAANDGARIWRAPMWSSAAPAALMASMCEALNATARQITADEVRRALVISPRRIGEDACEDLAEPPFR